RPIRSSNGSTELRPIVRTAFAVGDQIHEFDLSLANRDAMGFRMLLGREAVRGKFVVDPGRSYLFGKRSRYPDQPRRRRRRPRTK
ncbi:MAG TPA: RimK/LysX family protein, partial [Pirellulales bacterium]